MIEGDAAYVVDGMTCDHCRTAVIGEVSAVPGVTAVDVDLATGRLVVHGDADVAAVTAAVVEAGYAVRR